MDFSVTVDGKRVKPCSRLQVYVGIRMRMISAALWAAKEGIEAAIRDEVAHIKRSRGKSTT